MIIYWCLPLTLVICSRLFFGELHTGYFGCSATHSYFWTQHRWRFIPRQVIIKLAAFGKPEHLLNITNLFQWSDWCLGSH